MQNEMTFETIVNPKSNRKVRVKTWAINPREVKAAFKSGEFKHIKDLSWHLLSAKNAIKVMEREQYGDSDSNNFASSVFSNALDWNLGFMIINYIDEFLGRKQWPKPFKIAVTRSGNIFIINSRGEIARTY